MSKAKTRKSTRVFSSKGKRISDREAVDALPELDVPEIQLDSEPTPQEAPVAEEVEPNQAQRGARAATSARGTSVAAPKALSCLDAAVAVLKAGGQPMRCQEMIDAMAEQKLWTSTAPTPAATLSSAILREMKKGAASRFIKAGRGQFTLKA